MPQEIGHRMVWIVYGVLYIGDISHSRAYLCPKSISISEVASGSLVIGHRNIMVGMDGCLSTYTLATYSPCYVRSLVSHP